jgi:hypothetical protein
MRHYLSTSKSSGLGDNRPFGSIAWDARFTIKKQTFEGHGADGEK